MSNILVTNENLDAVMFELETHGIFGFDTETEGLRPYQGHRIFSAIWSTYKDNFYFNFSDKPDHLGNKAPEEYILPRRTIQRFKRLLDNPDNTIYVHNAKFDMHFVAVEKASILFKANIICTQAMARLVHNQLPSYSLAALGEKIGHKKDDTVEKYISKHKLYTLVDVGKKKPRKDKHYDLVPFDIMSKYGMQDGRIVFELGNYVNIRLQELGKEQSDLGLPDMQQVVLNEIKLTKTLFKMEAKGIKIDREYCQKAYDYEVEMYQEAASKFYSFTDGIEFEDAASCFKQAFTKLGLICGKTEKGNDSYSVDNLPDNELTEIILQYRHHYKRATTYFKNFLDLADDNDIIHCNFKQYGTTTGRLSSSEPNLQNCLSLDTEILTPGGYKKYNEVKKGDLVAAYCKQNDCVKYSRVLDYIFHKKDETILLKSNNIDIEMTPAHRFLIQGRNGKKRTVNASAIPSDYKMLHASRLLNSKKKIGNHMVRYIIACQADSWLTKGHQRVFSFRKSRKIKRLKLILKLLNIPHKTTSMPEKLQTKIIVDLVDEPKEIKKYIPEKKFTYKLLELSYLERRIFLRELRFWDGLSTRIPLEYCSKEKENTDVVQAIGAITNTRINVSLHQNMSGRFYNYLYGKDRSYSYTTNMSSTKGNIAPVWCVNVDTGFIVVRSNGKNLITGNCPKRGEDKSRYPVRKAFIPREGFMFVMIDWDQMEYRLLLDIAGEDETIDKILGGLDVHTATAEMMAVEREPAKTLNFMLLYGGGAAKLAAALGVLVSRAKELKAKYFRTLRKVQNLVKSIQATSKLRGYIVNWLGRRILNTPGSEYKMPNHYIQGGCGDVAKVAMNEIEDYLQDIPTATNMLLTVHDECIFEVPIDENHTDVMLDEIKNIMEEAYPHKRLPLTAGIDYSLSNWHYKKPWK